MKPCNALLVYPRFEQASFWDYKLTCELAGKKSMQPPLGLITIAALLPPEWTLRLVDRNTDDLTDDDIDWADLVMTGGMIPQRPDAQRVIELCHARGKPVVVGGPDVTSSPEAFPRADFRVLGEAETTIAELAAAWDGGRRSGTFEAERYATDITKSPIPRFDLLDIENYLMLGVQYSRGCPFTCEFCDIIELYGRVPRTKTNAQMLAELDALYATGYRGTILFVDDNLIGNKKAVKAFLPELRDWLTERGYPFDFATEASINMAEDPELLALMRDTNFGLIFIGIESPDSDTLAATRKKQNMRRDLIDSVERIYRAGMFVAAGYIIGFDTEKDSVADAMIRSIEDTSIPVAMVGLLTALPETQLTRRLIRENRLDPARDLNFASDPDKPIGDQCTAGLNFEPARRRSDILKDYRKVLTEIYAPQTFFARTRRLNRLLKRPKLPVRIHPYLALRDSKTVLRALWRLVWHHPDLRLPFLRTILECLLTNPAAAKPIFAILMIYFHIGPFAQYVIKHLDGEIAALAPDEGKPHADTTPTERYSTSVSASAS